MRCASAAAHPRQPRATRRRPTPHARDPHRKVRRRKSGSCTPPATMPRKPSVSTTATLPATSGRASRSATSATLRAPRSWRAEPRGLSAPRADANPRRPACERRHPGTDPVAPRPSWPTRSSSRSTSRRPSGSTLPTVRSTCMTSRALLAPLTAVPPRRSSHAVRIRRGPATSHYLLGYLCFVFADMNWAVRQIAAAIFTTPPTCSYEEAIKHFETAEKARWRTQPPPREKPPRATRSTSMLSHPRGPVAPWPRTG